jgi:hypothetical protein
MQAVISVTTEKADLADGQIAGNYVASIAKTDGTEPQTQTVTDVTSAITFSNLTPGDYTLTVCRQDTTGATIGEPVVNPFTVAGAIAPAPVAAQTDIPASVVIQLM